MKYIYREPAVVSNNKLIIGDLHIGLESELSNSGIEAPNQTQEMIERINKILLKNNCKELIILGDLKHSIPWARWREKEKLRNFLEELDKKTHITIVKGNHDSSIEEYIDREVKEPQGYKKGGEYFLHGHAEPKKEAFQCKTIFMSHLHPVIKITDSLGKTTTHKTWLRGKARKNNKEANIIIVPAFNKLITGKDVRKKFIGPMKKYIDLKNLEATLLNGVKLGKIDALDKEDTPN